MNKLDQFIGISAIGVVACSLAVLLIHNQPRSSRTSELNTKIQGPSFPVPTQFKGAYWPAFEQVSADDVPRLMPFTKIVLSHSGCYGACPRYTVTYDSNLIVTLEVLGNCQFPLGRYQSKLGSSEYTRLCYILSSLKFENLNAIYRAPWTDDDECVISAIAGGTSIVVRNYGRFGPPTLDCIQGYIENLTLQKFRNFR